MLRMATGGNLTRSDDSTDDDQENQQNASTEAESILINFPCHPCRENGTMLEAQHYCPKCDEYFCDGCIRFHRRMALLRDHVVYGKSDFDKWGQRTTSSHLKEKCKDHPTETVTMVCVTCNELCCGVCISINHSNCNNKNYIPSAAIGILNSRRKEQILNKIEKTSEKATKCKNKLGDLLQLLNAKQISSLEQINDLRRQAEQMFTNMEDRVTSLANILHDNIDEDLKTCNDLTVEMNSMKENVNNTDIRDESQVFMDVVMAENSEIKATREIDKIEDSNSQLIVEESKFVVDTNINTLLQKTNLSFRFPFILFGHNDNRAQKAFHLRGYIEGICQLPDGTFILADSSAFSLIWLSKSYKSKQGVFLDEAPSAVCYTESNHIAVSLNCKLQVFLVDKDIKHVPTKDLIFKHCCCGLAYNDEKYYTSDNAHTVYVYDIKGVCQNQIEALFQMVRHIAIRKEAGKIYVTDIENGLITMDLEGNVLSILETQYTKGAYGVCVTSTGNVLVTNYLQDTVIEVNQNGNTVLNTNFVNLPSDQSPRAICFDMQTTNIMVSENPIQGSCMVTVYC